MISTKVRFFKAFQLTYSSQVSFHTITFYFIPTLSLSIKDFNAILLVIDKFNKIIIFLSSKPTYKSVELGKLLCKFFHTSYNVKTSIIILSIIENV